jgi:hypothetical protein
MGEADAEAFFHEMADRGVERATGIGERLADPGGSAAEVGSSGPGLRQSVEASAFGRQQGRCVQRRRLNDPIGDLLGLALVRIAGLACAGRTASRSSAARALLAAMQRGQPPPQVQLDLDEWLGDIVEVGP